MRKKIPPQSMPRQLDDARLRQMWEAGETCKAIGIALGCSAQLVSRRASLMGLARRNTDTTQLPIRSIVNAYVHHGMTMEQIRDELRKRWPLASVLLVRNILKANRVTSQPRWRYRIEQGKAKQAECVKLARAGMSYPQIAAQLGLSRRQVAIRVRKVLPPMKREETCLVFGVDAMLQRFDAGETYAEVARAVGCHWSTVRYHVRKRDQQRQRQAVAS